MTVIHIDKYHCYYLYIWLVYSALSDVHSKQVDEMFNILNKSRNNFVDAADCVEVSAWVVTDLVTVDIVDIVEM